MIGSCYYCEREYQDLRWQTQEEADREATARCSCSSAVEAKTVDNCREYLKARFPLLEENGPSMMLMLRCMGGVALQHAAACTVQLTDGRRVRFTPGKDLGTVRVSISKQSKITEDVRASNIAG